MYALLNEQPQVKTESKTINQYNYIHNTCITKHRNTYQVLSIN